MKRKYGIVVLIVLLVALAVAGYFIYRAVRPEPAPPAAGEAATEAWQPEEPPSGQSPPLAEPEALAFVEYYPTGELITSGHRGGYEAGQLRIYIPRLEYEGDVLNGTDQATLAKGVGLFDYAMLPSADMYNANTSIAGHRDIHGKEFYYIDTVVPGDLVYLTYAGRLFTYEVEENFVTDDEDWDPIRIREYPCVTLQSCTPIGIASERIIVVGRLIAVEEKTEFPQ